MATADRETPTDETTDGDDDATSLVATEPISGGDRVTVRIPESQVDRLDTFVEESRFASRSQAVRHALADLLDTAGSAQGADQ